MYVKDWMTKNVVTLNPFDSITDAFDVMKKGNFHRVPICSNGKLVGLITGSTLADFAPSKATTLSVYEINSLLNKTSCKDIMITNVHTIGPNALLEEAAEKMNEHNITCLPVVEDDGQIVGIITQKVIFGAFIDLMGYYAKGSRVVIDIDKDEPGILQKLGTVTAQHNINITHFIVTRYSGLQIVIRTDETDDMKVTNILTSNGFIVSDHRTNKN